MKAYEIDGPARAYFEYEDGGEKKRCTYRVIGWCGFNPFALVRKANEIVAQIAELSFRNGGCRIDRHPVIFWRRRFELSHVDAQEGGHCGLSEIRPIPEHWKLTFRLGVVPDLTEDQWREVCEVSDGAPLSKID